MKDNTDIKSISEAYVSMLSEAKNKYEIKKGEKKGKPVYQLYINGELKFTDFDKKEVERMKKNYQRSYRNRTKEPF